MRQNVILRALPYIGGLLIVLTALTTLTQLHYVTTESLGKEKYYLTIRFLNFKRGDIVTFEHTTPHLGKALYTKQVIGLPGDAVRKVGNAIFIKGKELPLQPFRQKGKVMTPLEPLTQEESPVVIPGGYVFVAGNNPDSYDSRYGEYGLVPMDQIIGRSFPVV